MLAVLDTDPYFADFNFSALRDPALKQRVTNPELYQLVYDARNGDETACATFADVVFCTLRKATFECFERTHGPQAVSHADWMHAKLSQFFDILLYEKISASTFENGRLCNHTTEKPPGPGFDFISGSGPAIQPDEIESAFGPDDNTPGLWYPMVQAVCQCSDNRLGTLQAWLEAHRNARRSADPRESVWGKNRDRNEVINNCLARGLKREMICAELDRWNIPVNLPALVDAGFQTWTEGWADPQGREALQRLYSKRS